MSHFIKEILIFKGSEESINKLWSDLYSQPEKLYNEKQWLVEECQKKFNNFNKNPNKELNIKEYKEFNSIQNFASQLNCGYLSSLFSYNSLTNKEKDFIMDSLIKYSHMPSSHFNQNSLPTFLEKNWEKIILAKNWSDELNYFNRILFGSRFGGIPVANFGNEIINNQLLTTPKIEKKANEIKIIQEFDSFYENIKILPLLVERYNLQQIQQRNYSWDWGEITQINFLPKFQKQEFRSLLSSNQVAKYYKTSPDNLTDLLLDNYANTFFEKWNKPNKINNLPYLK